MDTAFIITPFIRVKCGLFEEIPNFCSTLFSLILPTPVLLFELLCFTRVITFVKVITRQNTYSHGDDLVLYVVGGCILKTLLVWLMNINGGHIYTVVLVE